MTECVNKYVIRERVRERLHERVCVSKYAERYVRSAQEGAKSRPWGVYAREKGPPSREGWLGDHLRVVQACWAGNSLPDHGSWPIGAMLAKGVALVNAGNLCPV
jgi:hypothetical protein